MRMLIREIAADLNIHLDKANYYRQVLKRERMLDPHRVGNRLEYTKQDIHHFHMLHEYVSKDNLTAGEAVRYIREGVSPSQALDKVKQLNAQLEAAQSKIVELRKPSFWNKISNWFSKFFNKGGGEREVA